MFFLHTDARLAAASLCDQDAKSHLLEALSALTGMYSTPRKTTQLCSWVLEDAFNYHWLSYFADCLQHRVDSGRYFSKVKNLRCCLPDGLSANELTCPPYVLCAPHSTAHFRRLGFSTTVASYRSAYIYSRHGYAEWRETGCPSWFLRMGTSLLSERDRSAFLLRVKPAGHSRPDDSRSLLLKREELRDGPMAETTGDDGGTFLLWSV